MSDANYVCDVCLGSRSREYVLLFDLRKKGWTSTVCRPCAAMIYRAVRKEIGSGRGVERHVNRQSGSLAAHHGSSM